MLSLVIGHRVVIGPKAALRQQDEWSHLAKSQPHARRWSTHAEQIAPEKWVVQLRRRLIPYIGMGIKFVVTGIRNTANKIMSAVRESLAGMATAQRFALRYAAIERERAAFLRQDGWSDRDCHSAARKRRCSARLFGE